MDSRERDRSSTMSFYERRILPHIINLGMNTKVLQAERTRCLQEVKGVVLEIGFGTGLNLPHYPSTVTKIVGVDPSETSAKLARKRIAASPVPVETIGLSAENLPVPDGRFESIRRVDRAGRLCERTTREELHEGRAGICRFRLSRRGEATPVTTPTQ